MERYNYIKTFDLDTTQDIEVSIPREFEKNARYLGVILSWSGADSNDATFKVYLGKDTDNNSLAQYGSTKTLATTSSLKIAEHYNIELGGGINRALFEYAKGTNTEGTATIYITVVV